MSFKNVACALVLISVFTWPTLSIAQEQLPKTSSEISVIDILGRHVSLEKPAKKVVLGEGRFVAVLGILGLEQPMSYIAGMMNEFRVYDPNSFAEYRRVYPEIETIPTFGHTSEDSVSLEKLLLTQPDVAILGLGGHGPSARSKHIVDKLEQAGIPVLFIDFRNDPIANTPRSIEIVGQLLGRENKAEAFATWYQQRIAVIKDRVADIPEDQHPKVLFDLRVDNSQDCCFSVAKGLFASMAQLTGAKSVATEVLNAPVGKLSKEYILTTDIDVYVGTATGGADLIREGAVYSRLIAGVGVNELAGSAALRQVIDGRGLSSLPAVKSGRVYGLWHHFYNSPLNLYAIEKMATWFHPEHFSDFNPEQTLERLLSDFAPLNLNGNYSASW